MPTLIDFSQVAIAGALFAQEQTIDISMTRHIILNSVRAHHAQNRGRYGETIICCDAGNTWRKEAFQFYKANRKHDNVENGFNWTVFFEHLGVLKEEMRQFLPFKVLQVERCEADDIIGVLTRYFYEQNKQPVKIISGDKDFKQLHVYENVSQFSPMLGKAVIEKAPEYYRKLQIIKGDSGDGVPNIYSSDDFFVDPNQKRQKPMTESRIEYFMNTPKSQWSEEQRRNYDRNKMLVDLIDGIPQKYRDEILNTYRSAVPAPKSGLLNYMVRNRMSNLLNSIQDFM